MPNRVLRDWTDSEKVDTLSFQAEALFTRLIMKADDFGCFHANPKLLRAYCFPLRIDQIKEADICLWLAECESAGLLFIYSSNNKQYLRINNFGQRLRIMRHKFPEPTETQLPEVVKGDTQLLSNNLRSIDSNLQQVAATRGNPPPEVETKLETEVEVETNLNPKPETEVDVEVETNLRLIPEFEFETETNHQHQQFVVCLFSGLSKLPRSNIGQRWNTAAIPQNSFQPSITGKLKILHRGGNRQVRCNSPPSTAN